MDLRRIALGGLVALPLAAGGGVVAAKVFGPSLVQGRLEAAAREFGLAARVADVSVGLAEVRLRDVHVGDRASGLSLQADRVVLEGAPIFAGLRGSVRGFDAIRVEGARLELVSGSPALDRLRSRLTGGAGAGEPPAGRSSGPRLEVVGAAVRVVDAHGALLAVDDGTASAADGKVELSAGSLQVGARGSHRLELNGGRVAVVRVAGELRIEAASARSATLYLASAEAEGRSAGSRREGAPDDAQEAAPEQAGGAAPRRDPGVDVDAAAQEAIPPERPGLARRLMALASAERGATPDRPDAEPGADQDEGRPAQFALGFTTGAEVSVASGLVRGPRGTLLDELSVRATALADHALQVAGGGRGAGGGRLEWDMRLWPTELRADGRVVLESLSLGLVAPLLPSIPWHEPERSTVSARVVVKAESVERLLLSGRAELRGAAIASERVAPAPVTGIDIDIEGEGHFFPSQRRLEVDSGRVTLGKARVDVTGAVEWAREHYLLQLDATMAPLPCTDAVHALPRELLADMAQAEFTGSLGGKLHLVLDSRRLQDGELEFDIADRCEFTAVPAMADLRRFKLPFVHSVAEPDGSVFEMETGPGTAKWTYLEDVSPFLVHAILAHEDAQFFTHRGFAPAHIRNALIRNLKEGRYVVGASTITMQLVKNIFLRREKTLARKIQEVLLTWWIERVLDKHEILELYLNVIEYGPGVYGIRDGARHYFNRLPSELSPAEAIYLSTILPNPKSYHAAFERGSLSPGWVEKMRKIFKRMKERGWYDPQAVEFGLRELDGFRFVPEGMIAPPRHVEGHTAPLPYQAGLDSALGDWGDGTVAPDAWDVDDSTQAEP